MQNETSTAGPTNPSPALLPGYPNCSTTHVPLPPGPYYQAKDFIASWIQPVVIVVGVFGNILTIIVLRRSNRKLSSTTLYLMVLAVSDTVFLLNGPLRQWIRHSWKYDIRGLHEYVCKLTVCLTYGTYQFSSWLLVVLTIERVVSVLWPHKVRNSCTSAVSKVVVLVTFVCIFGLNSHWFYGVGTSKLDYYAVKTCMPLFKDYAYFFHHVWHYINFAVAFAIPFVILAVGNGIIIYQLKKSQIDRKQMSSVKSRGNSRMDKEKRTITIVLILLSTVFFLSQTPVSIYFIYAPFGIAKANELACNNYEAYTEQAEFIWLCYTVGNILGYMNATLNFFMYTASGSRFRAEIKALFRCEGARAIGVYESSSSVRDATHHVTEMSVITDQKIATISNN